MAAAVVNFMIDVVTPTHVNNMSELYQTDKIPNNIYYVLGISLILMSFFCYTAYKFEAIYKRLNAIILILQIGLIIQ